MNDLNLKNLVSLPLILHQSTCNIFSGDPLTDNKPRKKIPKSIHVWCSTIRLAQNEIDIIKHKFVFLIHNFL